MLYGFWISTTTFLSCSKSEIIFPIQKSGEHLSSFCGSNLCAFSEYSSIFYTKDLEASSSNCISDWYYGFQWHSTGDLHYTLFDSLYFRGNFFCNSIHIERRLNLTQYCFRISILLPGNDLIFSVFSSGLSIYLVEIVSLYFIF